MNLSKTKYCNGAQCPKILWLDKNKPEVKEEIDNTSIMDNGNDVHEVARDLLGVHKNVSFNEDLNKMIEETKEYLKEENVVITEASFNYNNNFASIDLLKKSGNNYEIYEVKSSTHLKDVFKEDISYQYYVLKSLGYNITKCYVVHINSNYERHGDLNLNELFTINDVTDYVFNNEENIIRTIKEINEYMKNEKEKNKEISESCFSPYACPYFNYCSSVLPEKNIFTLPMMQTKTKLKYYRDGKYSYDKLLESDISEKYKRIIDYDLNNREDFINKNNIKKFMSSIYYPLYFLDFETYQMSIPKYDGIKPYEQIPFQYSLHYYEKEASELLHKEFLVKEGTDTRRSLAESLVNDIPLDVCTLAYNMSFEKTVIKRLSEEYPDLKEHLMNIHDHIIDLMIPFKNGDYYSKNMHGSYSIKYVLPALFEGDEELNYKNLDLIHNGSEAMNAFASLEEMTPEELKYTRERLLEYCKLDTYAMVKIYQKLKKI